jgi:hypothetical protein
LGETVNFGACLLPFGIQAKEVWGAPHLSEPKTGKTTAWISPAFRGWTTTNGKPCHNRFYEKLIKVKADVAAYLIN